MNLIRIKLTAILLLFSFVIKAQRLTIHPFFGYQYNWVHVESNGGILFSELNQQLTYTLGLNLVYYCYPKMKLEIGVHNSPIAIDIKYINPITKETSGNKTTILTRNTLNANMHYNLYSPKSNWVAIKGIVGIGYLFYKNGSWKGRPPESIDTTYLKNLYSRTDITRSNQILLNTGVTAEFRIKQKNIVDLRINYSLGFQENFSLSPTATINGITYTNKYSTNGSFINIVLGINLNTLFSKW